MSISCSRKPRQYPFFYAILPGLLLFWIRYFFCSCFFLFFPIYETVKATATPIAIKGHAAVKKSPISLSLLFYPDHRNGAALLGFNCCILCGFRYFIHIYLGKPILCHSEYLRAGGSAQFAGNTTIPVDGSLHDDPPSILYFLV
jgi:hypothetical protein